MKIRVLMTRKFFDEDIRYLRRGLSEDVELVAPLDYTENGVAESVEGAHALLGEMITDKILERAKHLRLIQVPWTGVDRLNFDLLKKYPRLVVCNSHSNSLAVAEMAVSLMLAIMKKVPFHDAKLRQGEWMRPQRDNPMSCFPPTLLSGRVVGFIGFGAIAQHIAGLLQGFRLRFVATDANMSNPSRGLLSMLHPPSDWRHVAEESDAIFITVPLLPETRGMINEDFFRSMKRTAYLVNTSRGEVVDEEALYGALRQGQISGAAVDTWYQYPKPGQPVVLPSSRFPFHELNNLVLSPHRAGFSEGDLPHLADVVENLNALAGGNPLRGRVDVTAGY